MSDGQPVSKSVPWAFSRVEAARKLGVCVRTIDNSVKRGELKAVRYFGRTMIPVSELLRLLGVPDHEITRYLSH